MAHFAELNRNNTVLRVIVVNNEDCLDANGNEAEAVGAAFCTTLLGGRWVQTSYSGRTIRAAATSDEAPRDSTRGKFAGIGDTYDPVADVFVSPTLNE